MPVNRVSRFGNVNGYLVEAKALRALEPARPAPGHGKVVESPGAAMDAAIKRGG